MPNTEQPRRTVAQRHEPVIMRRMDALKQAIGDRYTAPHRQQEQIEFAYDQVLRALTKMFGEVD